MKNILKLLLFLSISGFLLIASGCAPAAATRPAAATMVSTAAPTKPAAPVSTATTAAPVETATPVSLSNSAGVELPSDAAAVEQQVIHLAGTEGEFLSWDASINNRIPGGTFGISDSCTRMDNDLNLLPNACLSWEASSDGLTWTFTLPKDRVWSDGIPLTASDWVFTLQRDARPDYDGEPLYRKAQIVNWSDVVKGLKPAADLGVKKADDYSFTVTTDRRIAFIPQLFSKLMVVPEHIVKDRLADGSWALDPANAVSAGPYKLESYTKGKEVVWAANDTYKGPTPALAEKIVISFIAPADRLAAYKKGDLDIIGGEGVDSLSPADLDEIYADPALKSQLLSWTGFETSYMFFDAWNDPFNYYIVRQAFDHAIDRSALINGPLKNQAVAAYSMNPPGFPGEKAASLKKLQPYDPALAVYLMNKAGYPNGKDFPAVTLFTRAADPSLAAAAKMITEMLKQILNVNVTVVDLDDKLFSEKESIQKSKGRGDLLFGIDSYAAQFVDGSDMLSLWGGCPISGVTKRGMPGKHTWYYAEYNDDLCQAQSIMSDNAKRTQIYQGAENILISDPALMPLYHPLVNVLVNPKLKGAALTPNNQKAVTLRDYENSTILAGLYKTK